MEDIRLENQMNEAEEHSLADIVLVSKYLAGDRRAFEALVCRYQGGFRMFAYGFLRDEEAVKDAMQVFWLKVSRPDVLKTYKVEANFKTWLYSILRNLCLDMIRRLKVVHRSIPVAEFDDYSFSHDSDVHLHEVLALRRSMDKILAKIDPDAVDLLMMRFEDGKTKGEIAAELEIPEGTVQSRTFYTMQKIRDLIVDENN